MVTRRKFIQGTVAAAVAAALPAAALDVVYAEIPKGATITSCNMLLTPEMMCKEVMKSLQDNLITNTLLRARKAMDAQLIPANVGYTPPRANRLP